MASNFPERFPTSRAITEFQILCVCSVCVCVCAHSCSHTWVCSCWSPWMWKTEANRGCQSSPSTLCDTGSLDFVCLVFHCMCQASWLPSLQGLSCFALPSPKSAGIYMQTLMMLPEFWEFKLRSSCSQVKGLIPEPLPQPYIPTEKLQAVNISELNWMVYTCDLSTGDG